MKKIAFILLLLAVSAVPLAAQTPAVDDVRSEIVSFSERVSSIDCDFVQAKESSLLAETAYSKGHMTYRRPDRLQWSYMEPFQLTLTADGSDFTVEKDGRTEAVSGSRNGFLREMTRLIMSNIDGSILSNDKLFKTGFEVVGGEIRATLLPQKSEVKRLWSRLVLYYDRKSMNATRFEMHEASGDLTVITFSNVKYGFSE